MTVSQIMLRGETAFDPTRSYATKAIRQKNQLGKKEEKRKEKNKKRKNRPPVIGGEEVIRSPSQLENNSVVSVILHLDQWGRDYSAPKPWRIIPCPVSNYFYDIQSMYTTVATAIYTLYNCIPSQYGSHFLLRKLISGQIRFYAYSWSIVLVL